MVFSIFTRYPSFCEGKKPLKFFHLCEKSGFLWFPYRGIFDKKVI